MQKPFTINNPCIDPTASIDQAAKIDDGTAFWINVQIKESAIVSKHCSFSKDDYIDCNVSEDVECKIQNPVPIYDGVTIENQVFMGPNSSFTNDKVPRAFNSNWTITKHW